MAELSQIGVSTHRQITGGPEKVPRKTKTKSILSEVGKELKENPPSILSHTRAKYGPLRAAKQKTAILLSKARKAGASVPKPRSSRGIK